ncbi:MAG TPA: glycoside hydrolase family 108 protein [Alphaproteobacteria bacterium]|nr:glycoside hydrolase family 108 protein [Alphaproteobacteria bacterium]
MNRNFERSLSLVLKSEGGFVNDPHDPGGATNLGVTIATFRQYVNPNGTVADLKALTTAQAGKVYKGQYWDAVKGDQLPDGVDYAVFDFAVNSGPGRAAKFLQAIVGVSQDGQIGPATLAAAANLPRSTIIQNICDNRLTFLKGLPTWSRFGRGWSSRVASVRTVALAMVGPTAPTAPIVPAPVQPPVNPVPAPTPIPIPVSNSIVSGLLSLISSLFKKGN